MTRIFTILAALDALALLSAFLFGVMSKLNDSVRDPRDSTYMIHFALGLTAAIITLLVHCLIFTYFLGTGRWVKEVRDAYDLPDEPLPKQTRELKRRTFPPALIAMLITIATTSAGAGAQLKAWPWEVHGLLALTTLIINFWAYTVEYRNVSINAKIIDQVMIEVDRIRAERGLPSNDEALRAEERFPRSS